MADTNNERVARALSILSQALAPLVEREYRADASAQEAML